MASAVTRFTLRTSWRSLTSASSRSCLQSQTLRALSSLQLKSLSPVNQIGLNNSFVKHQQWRFYSPASLTKADVESRIITVCKAFDKITADKVTLDAHFINDLGLDSLDHVEVIMAIEDEFGFEIPDEHAEKLLTPAKIAEYVCEHEKVFS